MWGGGLEIRACNHGDQLAPAPESLLVERMMLPIFSPLRNLQGFNGYVPGLGADTDVHPSLCVQVFRQRSFLGREDGVTDALRQRSLPPAEPFPGGWNVCEGCDRLAPLLLPPPPSPVMGAVELE